MNLPPWQVALWDGIVARAAADLLPHALLLTGPPAIGKRAFAERLGQFLLCQRRAQAPCGQCRACELYAHRSQRDPEETRPDGSLAQPHGHPGHPDARFVGFTLNEKSKKMYSEIVVEQVRDLSAWLAMTSQFGGDLVGLIEPAEALNVAAANALLKTLEEPSPGRYLILVSAHPARLSATIRSRCQRIEFKLPAADAAVHWLVQQGLDRARAAVALAASGGNPAQALAWAANGQLALRDEVAADLRALRAGKARSADVANRWARSEADSRLWFAAALVQAESQALAQRNAGPLALTADADLTKLAAWFDQANRARELLRGPLRPELVLIDVLLAWPRAAQAGVAA
jgi:DNA polymerase-3 subunit delta'